LKEFSKYYPKYSNCKIILYKIIIKPGFDFLVALLLLVILSPLIFVTLILLAIVNKGNIFFLQLRPGLHGKPFKIIKFKTMRDAFDSTGNPLPDEERLTKIGKFIRSISLDELLQLINVVKGDMSLVGPRPLLIQYLKRYTLEQARRHEVKPGITGWAQVNGRNAISWEEKFKLDVMYVENVSFALDMKILWMTFLNVVLRKGISADRHATMEEFRGSVQE
jgi:lipopolysaccharide/colanic/teichoic acid biosynthesis glycosyltransferase